MEVTLAVLSDYSNVSREGKLNIMGIFDAIRTGKFPVIHPSMQLVLSFEASRAESGSIKKIRVRLLDEDGGEVLETGTQFTLSREGSGISIKRSHIVNLKNVLFENPGLYSFHILVNGEEKKTVPLRLVKTPASSR